MLVNHEMLLLARQRKGFSQSDAAKRLGVRQPFLSRVEGGISEPQADLINRASKIYGVPKSFFQQRDPIYGAPVSVHPMWRKQARVTSREMDAIVAELNIRILHLRKLLSSTEFEHDFTVPQFDIDEYNDPEWIAGTLRAHWKIPRGPISNLTDLVERAGVIVIHSDLGGSQVSGVKFSIPGVPPIIILNNSQSADRIRFTLAHELGHLVMHKFPTQTMEEEANQFASTFLMPTEDIKSVFAGRKIDLSLLAAFKPEWKVSMQALLYRAHTLKCLTPSQNRYLWQQINMRGIKLREPPELDFPLEVPSVLSDIINIYVDTLGYSVKDLAKLLHSEESVLIDDYPANFKKEPDKKNPNLRVVK